MGQETLKVKQLSKYGVQDETGAYINWSKTIKDSDKGKVVPGGAYVVDMFRAESGKGYINKVLEVKDSNDMEVPKLVAPVFKNTPVAEAINGSQKAPVSKNVPSATFAKLSEVMSKADWNAKDRSMMVGGLSHDAAVLAAAAATANAPMDSLLADYERALNKLMDIREEVK